MLDLISYLTGGSNRIKLKKHEYLKAGFWAFVLLGVVVLYALEIKYFNNTFEIGQLAKRAILVGAVLGGLACGVMIRRNPEMELLLKFQLSTGILILAMLLMPLVASLTNRLLSFKSFQEVPVEVVKIEGFYSSRFGFEEGVMPEPDGYHIFFLHNGVLQRLKHKTNPFPTAKEGDQVNLPMKKGFWGYEYVLFDL